MHLQARVWGHLQGHRRVRVQGHLCALLKVRCPVSRQGGWFPAVKLQWRWKEMVWMVCRWKGGQVGADRGGEEGWHQWLR